MERRKAKDRRKSVRDILEQHAKEDLANFKNIGDSLVRIEEHMVKNNEFMNNLSWLNDISKGTKLLKSPILWFLGGVVGLVALLGGVKALAAGFLAWVLPR